MPVGATLYAITFFLDIYIYTILQTSSTADINFNMIYLDASFIGSVADRARMHGLSIFIVILDGGFTIAFLPARATLHASAFFSNIYDSQTIEFRAVRGVTPRGDCQNSRIRARESRPWAPILE